MTQSKHTAGTWRVGEIRHAGAYQLVEHEGPRGYVCDVQAPIISGEFDEATRLANARLIAAAPELLEALKPLAKAADNYADCDDSKFIDEDATVTVGDLREARTALSRTTGETV